MKVVLASASPRRHQLLKELFAHFQVCPATICEDYIGATPIDTVKELAFRKIQGIAGDLVIGCDTIVYMDGIYYNKPQNRASAIEMLMSLSGRTHEVYSGLAIAYMGKYLQDYDKSTVTFKKLEPHIIEQYVDKYAPYDKAGGYGIQDNLLVESYTGCYKNIMGLPVNKLKTLLIKAGAFNG